MGGGGRGGGSLVCERLLPRNVVTVKWVVSCTRITCIQPWSRCSLTFSASSFFSEHVCCCRCFVFSSLPLLGFHHTSFVFIFGLLANSVSRLAWLGQPFWIYLFVCICLHPDAMSSVDLISDLLFQSAGIVFLDVAGRVSEGLVWLSICLSLAQFFLLLCS